MHQFPESPVQVYRGVCSNHICDLSVGDDAARSREKSSRYLIYGCRSLQDCLAWLGSSAGTMNHVEVNGT